MTRIISSLSFGFRPNAYLIFGEFCAWPARLVRLLYRIVTPYLRYDPDGVWIGASLMHFIFRTVFYVYGITLCILNLTKHESTRARKKRILWFSRSNLPRIGFPDLALLLINRPRKCLTLKICGGSTEENCCSPQLLLSCARTDPSFSSRRFLVRA